MQDLSGDSQMIEKRQELRTLKELGDLSYDKLRAEAKKWINYRLNEKGERVDMIIRHYPKVMIMNEHIEDWIKLFFNLTEEDLKNG